MVFSKIQNPQSNQLVISDWPVGATTLVGRSDARIMGRSSKAVKALKPSTRQSLQQRISNAEGVLPDQARVRFGLLPGDQGSPK